MLVGYGEFMDVGFGKWYLLFMVFLMKYWFCGLSGCGKI